MKLLVVLGLMVMLAGCTGTRCDQVRPYQQTRAIATIQVPEGLSEPTLRSRAPQVEPDAPTKRADGRCLEDPPEYIFEEAEDDDNGGN